jgi:hypothetical protein
MEFTIHFLHKPLCEIKFGLYRLNLVPCYDMRSPQKVKQPHYRPRQALRAPGGRGSQVFRQPAHEGGKVVSPTNRPPLPPRKDSWYSFLLVAESTPGP